MNEKRYLGDGVYVMYDGYGAKNQIALEDHTFYALLDFAKSIEWMKEE